MSSATVAAAPFETLNFDQKLDRLAEVALRVGLNLREGQELVLTAPTDALPLVRRVVEQAYKAGAKFVTTLLSDDELALARFRSAPDASFDYAPEWFYDGIANAFRSGAARMAITGANPALLSGQDPHKVSRKHRCIEGLQAGDAAHHPTRDQLDHHCGRDAGVGRARLPRRATGARDGQAVGRDLSYLPHHGREPGRGLEAAW
jgi:leucyl aminopeptidase (aminopeptidase T)